MHDRSIAIDGPAGVGKSTIAKELAGRLGYLYVDTGALYRAIAVLLADSGLTPDSLREEEVKELIRDLTVEVCHREDGQHVLLNGEDVTGRLRTEAISRMASVSSALPAVREKLLQIQKDLADTNNVVMDGRDIGTVVLPDAGLKIFLTAAPRVRAERRFRQLAEAGQADSVTVEQIERQIEERDWMDSHRAVAPLRPAADAVTVDSSDLSKEEEIRLLLSMAEEKIH